MTNVDLKERAMQAIRDAFAEVPYPGDDAIASPSEGWQEDDINQAFRGVDWRDVSEELIEEYAFVLPYFSPAGRHFYLPAFLLDRLQGPRKGSYDWVLRQLEPPEDMDRFKREYDPYPEAQREAIRLFLECLCGEALHKEHDKHKTGYFARKALDRYWERPGTALPQATAEPARSVEISQAILSAFADVPYPGDEAIAYSSTAWDGIAINHDFKGYHWRELPRGLLAFHHDVLNFLSIEGLHFFLPAYLLAALENLHDIRTAVVFILMPRNDLTDVKERFDRYTSAQKNAIRILLECARDEEPYGRPRYRILISLDRYWARGPQEPPRSTTDPAQRERVKRAILEAFADVPYPRDALVDPAFSSTEEIARDFKDQHFREVSRDVLIRHHDSLATFSEQAMQFFLPAYLLAALDDVYDIVYWAIYHLNPLRDSIDDFDDYFAHFTPAQKRAICLFLEHVRDAMPQVSLADLAQRALDMYWAAAAP